MSRSIVAMAIAMSVVAIMIIGMGYGQAHIGSSQNGKYVGLDAGYQ
jgi:hypothetical protein